MNEKELLLDLIYRTYARMLGFITSLQRDEIIIQFILNNAHIYASIKIENSEIIVYISDMLHFPLYNSDSISLNDPNCDILTALHKLLFTLASEYAKHNIDDPTFNFDLNKLTPSPSKFQPNLIKPKRGGRNLTTNKHNKFKNYKQY